MKRICGIWLLGCLAVSAFGDGNQLVLSASKDNFGRSNERNHNSGANESLAVAHVSNIRTIIAFDLSAVTNKIIAAEMRFRQQDTMDKKISMVVAPMVHTARNAAWGEGSGNLGARGQNSRPGESCYAYSAFREVPWESATGEPLLNLGDAGLWGSPIATFSNLLWEEGTWVRVPISNLSLLETIQKSKTPTITFGVWGTAGKGIYLIRSKNSAWAPTLHLTFEAEGK